MRKQIPKSAPAQTSLLAFGFSNHKFFATEAPHEKEA